MFKRSHIKRRSRADKIFTFINGIIMAFLSIIIIYPLYYILVASFTDPSIVARGKFLLYPEKLFLDGYQEIFKYRPIWTGYRNSIVYTMLNVALTICFPCLLLNMGKRGNLSYSADTLFTGVSADIF